MESCPSTEAEGTPNPEPKPHYILIDKDTNNVKIN